MITPLPAFIERFNAQPACEIVPKKELNDLPLDRRESYSQPSSHDNCEGLAQQIKQQQQGKDKSTNTNSIVAPCNNLLRCASGFEPATLLSQRLTRVDIITAIITERERIINKRLGETTMEVVKPNE